MSYSIVLTAHFQKEAKKLIKKYRSLKSELIKLGEDLAKDPTIGTPLGNDVYKVRLAISSKGKGKSGGARVITYVKVIDEKVYLVSIYDKSTYTNLTNFQITVILKKAGLLN